ncbi:MAG: MFS transporter, partial [Thermoproteota archaeon]|nr:MFS transporter [Thermoproteota archaeon]
GSLSDITRRRKVFVLLGYGISTISKPFFMVASNWFDAFVVRTMDRMGKGIRTAPRDALIADSVSESVSGKAFGIHRTIDQMGAIVGPIAAFLILQFTNIQTVFLLSLVPGAVAVIILVLFVKEVAIKKLASTTGIFKNIGALLKENRPFVIIMVVTGVFSIGAFNFSFVLLKSSELGVEQNHVPIVYAVINVAHTIIGIPAGILADRIGKEKVLLLGYAVFTLTSALMAVTVKDASFAYALAVLFGLYAGISETLQRAIIPRYVVSELRGTAYGLYSLVSGTCFFISNLTFGFIWDVHGVSIAALYSLCFSTVAILGLAIFMKNYSTATTDDG